MIATIPKSKITKIAIHVNAARQSMSQIKKSLGCQYIMNAGLFNLSTFVPINHLTVDGKVLSATATPYGYGIKDNALIFSYGNNVKAPSFLGAYPVLVRDGKSTNEKVPVGLGGYVHRTCLGVTKSGDVVMLCDMTNRSLSGVTGDLIKAGCDTAINLDGGASSQYSFENSTMTSTRIVHNYICIWTSPVVQATNATTTSTTSDDSAAATAWVKSMGISDGTNPTQPVTRQQVWQMLYRLKGKL